MWRRGTSATLAPPAGRAKRTSVAVWTAPTAFGTSRRDTCAITSTAMRKGGVTQITMRSRSDSIFSKSRAYQEFHVHS